MLVGISYLPVGYTNIMMSDDVDDGDDVLTFQDFNKFYNQNCQSFIIDFTDVQTHIFELMKINVIILNEFEVFF